MRNGCDSEGSHNTHSNFSISIAAVGETGASGKMISGAMVQGARRAGRGGLARQNALRLCDRYTRDRI